MPDGAGDLPPRVRRGRVAPRNIEWLLTVLPAFPLVLLVLRLWYAARQDTQVLLLLVQHVSPLGLLSSVLITGLWVIPAVVLVVRVLGALYLVSARRSSPLVRLADRIPDWVLVVAAAVALLTWQLRFLPTLAMLVLSVLGLTVRERGLSRFAVRFTGVVLPLLVAVACYALLAPAIADAVHEEEWITLVLLACPPGLTVLLTGPIPRASAWAISHGVALVGALVTPVVVGVLFLRVPILPLVAVEIEAVAEAGPAGDRAGDQAADREPDRTPDQAADRAGDRAGDRAVDRAGESAAAAGGTAPPGAGRWELPEVIIGYVIAVDDRLTTFLTEEGAVHFVPNDRLGDQVLCPHPGGIPASRVDLHGWYAEENMITWLIPDPVPIPDDPRCQGRRLPPEPARRAS